MYAGSRRCAAARDRCVRPKDHAVMGERGYKYDEILLHYYRGAEIRKIYG